MVFDSRETANQKIGLHYSAVLFFGFLIFLFVLVVRFKDMAVAFWTGEYINIIYRGFKDKTAGMQLLLLLSYRLTGELAEFFKVGFLVNWYSLVNLFPLPNNLGLDGTRAIHHLSKELPYVKNLFCVNAGI